MMTDSTPITILKLPPELLHQVLEMLPGPDITRCMKVCSLFRTTIQDSSTFRYIIELWAASLTDQGNHHCSMTVATRLTKLQRLTASWETWDHIQSDAIELAEFPTYDFQQGVLTVGGAGHAVELERVTTRSLSFYQLRSQILDREPTSWTIEDIGFDVIDYTTDPGQDLIVFLEAGHHEASDRSWRNILLRTMSDNSPHPNAMVHNLEADVRSEEVAPSFASTVVHSLVLRGELLAFVRSCIVNTGSTWTDLSIFNWKTGELLAARNYRYGASLTFIDERSFAIVKTRTTIWQTDQWDISVYHMSSPLSPVAIFRLPKLSASVLVHEILIRTEPNGTSPGIPFAPSATDKLLVLSFKCLPPENAELSCTMFMRTSELMALSALHPDSTIRGVPWDEWGPNCTRWMRNMFQNSFVCNVHGLRYVTLATMQRPAISIMDFNPRVIRKYASEGSVLPSDEWKIADAINSRVVTGESIVAIPGIFIGPIVTYLPYRETLVPSSPIDPHGALVLDADHVIQFKSLSNAIVKTVVTTL